MTLNKKKTLNCDYCGNKTNNYNCVYGKDRVYCSNECKEKEERVVCKECENTIYDKENAKVWIGSCGSTSYICEECSGV